MSTVPLAIRAVFILGLLAQVFWGHTRPPPVASAEALPAAPDMKILRLSGLGEPGALAKIIMLWLQAFDNQPGLSIPFNKLNYAEVIHWLEAILNLDDRFQYPLLSASRLYTETPDLDKKRQMLEFVHERFLQNPNKRWPWMTHAVYVAKHHLRDLQLALKYANALRVNVNTDKAPPWATQMEIYVLEDLGETESAKIIIGGLLESGRLSKHDNELRFLKNKLAELELKQQKGKKTGDLPDNH